MLTALDFKLKARVGIPDILCSLRLRWIQTFAQLSAQKHTIPQLMATVESTKAAEKKTIALYQHHHPSVLE